jgi:peptidoglycan/LPS O-acetylase OafA/YrhL
MNKQKRRNHAIEFWRFIYICAICIMHFSNSYFGASPYFDDAYAATEFFFIVSGYLLVMSYHKNKENRMNAWGYTFHKAIKLYPYYLLSFIAVFVFIMISEKESIWGWIRNLGGSVWELVFLQISGLKCFRLFNYPTWYISALLIAGYFIYTLLELAEEKFIKLIMPLAVLVIYCFFSKNTGNMDVWGGAKILHISDALMRAFAGMCLGGIGYQVNVALRHIQLNKKRRILLTIGEMAAFILVFYLIAQRGHTQVDFYVVGLLAIAVTLAFSGRTYTSILFKSRLFAWFGKISYPMFLNQIFVIYIMGAYIKDLGYRNAVAVFMVLLILVSMVEMLTLEGIRKIDSYRSKILKS